MTTFQRLWQRTCTKWWHTPCRTFYPASIPSCTATLGTASERESERPFQESSGDIRWAYFVRIWIWGKLSVWHDSSRAVASRRDPHRNLQLVLLLEYKRINVECGDTKNAKKNNQRKFLPFCNLHHICVFLSAARLARYADSATGRARRSRVGPALAGDSPADPGQCLYICRARHQWPGGGESRVELLLRTSRGPGQALLGVRTQTRMFDPRKTQKWQQFPFCLKSAAVTGAPYEDNWV